MLAAFFAFSSVAVASAGSGNRVRAELRLADQALGEVWQEAGDDEDAEDTYDLDAVATNLAHTETARQLAMKPRRPQATILAAVNDQADANVYEYADDATWAPADQQAALAEALATSVAVRSSVTTAMLVKAEKLTPGARGTVLRSIGQALSDGDPDLLLEGLAEEDGYGATAPTKASLAGSLSKVFGATDATLAELGRLADRIDHPQRKKVDDAISDIEESIAELPGWVDELLVDLAEFADDPEAAVDSFCAVLAGLPLPTPGACG